MMPIFSNPKLVLVSNIACIFFLAGCASHPYSWRSNPANDTPKIKRSHHIWTRLQLLYFTGVFWLSRQWKSLQFRTEKDTNNTYPLSHDLCHNNEAGDSNVRDVDWLDFGRTVGCSIESMRRSLRNSIQRSGKQTTLVQTRVLLY